MKSRQTVRGVRWPGFAGRGAASLAGGLVLGMLLAVVGCARKPSAQIELALNWFPEAEHGGYYAALVHGYYREAGLDVRILPGGPDTPVIARVATGRVRFGVENADGLIFGRAEGAPVVGLMAPIQTSPRCIMVHADTGITNLLELQNVTLAMSARGAFAHYLKREAPLTDVKIVPYSGTVAAFLLDHRYAQQGYVFSEPYVAAKQGATPRCLLLSDIGFNPYTSVLIASEATVREDPELVRAFVAASVRGWQQYVRDASQANAEIQRLNPEMTADVLDFGVQALRPLVVTAASPEAAVGRMTRARWAALLSQMESIEVVRPGAVAVDALFTDAFLPRRDTVPSEVSR
ncbi:MAG: ABC transporter substrate-binding protein [Lentisphaerae bacterium]|nr:ABC transporter substrate-binding protein [Lentisphaerota bacterium]